MSVVPFFWIWISLLIQGWWAVRSLHCIYELLLILFICVFRQEAVHHAVLKLHTKMLGLVYQAHSTLNDSL